jgi:hypothetical protein
MGLKDCEMHCHVLNCYLCVEKMGLKDCEMYCQPWTTRMPKAAQPNLNYLGEEIMLSFYHTPVTVVSVVKSSFFARKARLLS